MFDKVYSGFAKKKKFNKKTTTQIGCVVRTQLCVIKRKIFFTQRKKEKK
jgi:hypothetical protein